MKKLISNPELAILRYFGDRHVVEKLTSEITEISQATGIRDNEEVQRALYLLEGKNLVQPEPAGDLTSNSWKITDVGMKALGALQA